MKNTKWIEAYRKNIQAIWIRCILTNDEELFFDSFEGWKILKDKCDKEKLFFKKLSLQFRSHEVNIDVENCDGVYLIKSVMGQIGGPTKKFYTTGKVVGDQVYKTVWMIPELIPEKENIKDDIAKCFTETIIYNEAKKN